MSERTATDDDSNETKKLKKINSMKFDISKKRNKNKILVKFTSIPKH